jgi:GntR family transcriptional regulator
MSVLNGESLAFRRTCRWINSMKIKLDHNSQIPLHAQTEDLLRKLISQPEYRKGKMLPREIQLSDQLGISRATLRQALNKLVFEGLLIRRKGVGTRVTDRRVISSKPQNWQSFPQEMESKGIQVRNFELHISWVLPDEMLADYFDISPTKKILKLVRLCGDAELPLVYSESYFHPRIGLTGEEDFKRPIYEVLEKEHNTIVCVCREDITADAADPELASKLEVHEGCPVLIRKRFVYDIREQLVEYNIGKYKANSFVYSVESRRD